MERADYPMRNACPQDHRSDRAHHAVNFRGARAKSAAVFWRWPAGHGVGTKRLNEQVKRNLARFPKDFLCRLAPDEMETLNRSHLSNT